MKPATHSLLRLAPGYWPELVLMASLMLGAVGLNVLKPWPLKLLLDDVLPGRALPAATAWLTLLPGGATRAGLVAWLALGTVAISLAAGTLQAGQAYLRAGAGGRMSYDLGGRVFDHLQRLSPRFHHRHPAGDLLRRITTDSRCLRDLVLGVFFAALTSLLSIAVFFAVMWQLDPWLSLIALLVVVPLALAMKRFLGPMTERTYDQQQREGEMLAQAERTLSALPVVQAFTSEDREDARFRSLTGRAFSAYFRALAAQLHFTASVNTATAAGTAAIMIVGGFHVSCGALSIGSLIVFLAYLSALYAPLSELAQLSSGWAAVAAGARRVREVLGDSDFVRQSPRALPLSARSAAGCGHVRWEQVVFGYDPARPVLHGITLEARPGEVLALVGHTGAGKSTLVSLIPRLFDPWEGRVLLDGTDLRDAQLASLRARVAIVLQDPCLLPLSVAENIAYGRPAAPRDEIVAAAVAANADPFIRKLPQGYDTVIGQRGATLSGGERQRLAIARALLKDAPVLILDEPTSALDAQTECTLLEALSRLIQGRTTLIIAHRLSTIRQASRIVVLEGGRIVEMGTHDELLKGSGVFRRFYETQFGRPQSTPGPDFASLKTKANGDGS